MLEGHRQRQWFHGQGCSPTLPEQDEQGRSGSGNQGQPGVQISETSPWGRGGPKIDPERRPGSQSGSRPAGLCSQAPQLQYGSDVVTAKGPA